MKKETPLSNITGIDTTISMSDRMVFVGLVLDYEEWLKNHLDITDCAFNLIVFLNSIGMLNKQKEIT